MSEENTGLEVMSEVVKEAYNDGGKEVVKPTGKLVGLVPRAIKAALLPLEKWVLEREYNLAETEKLLATKLENIPNENIVTPEPYIAVPALQYISYSMDSEELRNMYANLLANSMNSVVKNEVHPSFVEIIKQLSPDEAKIMKYLSNDHNIPTLELNYYNSEDSFITIIHNFSLVGVLAGCEQSRDLDKYFDNLERLGLIQKLTDKTLHNKDFYQPLKEHPYIKAKTDETFLSSNGYKKAELKEICIQISSFGLIFCKVCIDNGGKQ